VQYRHRPTLGTTAKMGAFWCSLPQIIKICFPPRIYQNPGCSDFWPFPISRKPRIHHGISCNLLIHHVRPPSWPATMLEQYKQLTTMCGPYNMLQLEFSRTWESVLVGDLQAGYLLKLRRQTPPCCDSSSTTSQGLAWNIWSWLQMPQWESVIHYWPQWEWGGDRVTILFYGKTNYDLTMTMVHMLKHVNVNTSRVDETSLSTGEFCCRRA